MVDIGVLLGVAAASGDGIGNISIDRSAAQVEFHLVLLIAGLPCDRFYASVSDGAEDGVCLGAAACRV